MLHLGRTGPAKHLARLVVCAALLAGGAVFTAGGVPVPSQVPTDVRVSSAPSTSSEFPPPAPDPDGKKGAPAVETQPTVTSEPSSTTPIETRPTSTSGPSSTAIMETRPTISSKPSATAPGEDVIDTVYGSVSYGFLSTATWLDSFFGNERYQAESNESEFRIQVNAFRQGQTKMQYSKPDYSLRLVLPQLRKKTRLVIAGDPTVDTTSTAAQPVVPELAQPQPATSRNVGGAIQYFPVESARSSFSIRAGVKLHFTKLSVLFGPRYRYLIPLDPWALRFTEEVTWSSEQKWLSRTTIDFERPLYSSLFFRMSLEGVWTENVNGYPYALGFTLRQPLDLDRALLYSWINYFQTSPTNELVQELFVFGYRQRFWKPWLFLEIDPQISYPRNLGFAYTPGILFRLELVFGKKSFF